MENFKHFLKIYEELAEESFKKWGYYYPPRTWEELNSWDLNFFEKYLRDKEDGVKKTQTYLYLADNLNLFSFYNVFQKLEFDMLNNVLYQTSRQNLLYRGILASATDHCNVFFNAINAFSCNDFEIIDHFFPKQLPQSKGKFYTEVSVNLLKVLYYKEKEFEFAAVNKADKFLLKKITTWEKYVILYLKALISQNEVDASICLQELCLAYQKMDHSVSKLHNKLAKCFASEIHGLYRFAKIIDEQLFNKLTQPQHHSFCNEFELWQKENNYPKGRLFYKYPISMDYVNKIFEAELPTVTLYNPYPDKKELFKNVDKFIEDLNENVKKIL